MSITPVEVLLYTAKFVLHRLDELVAGGRFISVIRCWGCLDCCHRSFHSYENVVAANSQPIVLLPILDANRWCGPQPCSLALLFSASVSELSQLFVPISHTTIRQTGGNGYFDNPTQTLIGLPRLLILSSFTSRGHCIDTPTNEVRLFKAWQWSCKESRIGWMSCPG